MKRGHGKRRHGKPGRACGVALSFLLLTAGSTAWADSFRCGRKVVRTGDTGEAVRARCGDPQRTDSGTEALWLPEGHQRVRVERWYYKSGDRRLERIVLLYRGEVVAVRTGSR